MANTSSRPRERGISISIDEVEAALDDLGSFERKFLVRYVEIKKACLVAEEWGISPTAQARCVARIRKAFGGIPLCFIADQYRVYENEKRRKFSTKDTFHQESKAFYKRSLPPIEQLVTARPRPLQFQTPDPAPEPPAEGGGSVFGVFDLRGRDSWFAEKAKNVGRSSGAPHLSHAPATLQRLAESYVDVLTASIETLSAGDWQ